MSRQSWEWIEEDVLGLISGEVKESLNLDYKRCDSLAKKEDKKRELSKDVSAFANSAGGTLVYGMIEEGNLPTKIDIGYDPQDISREWIENVIMTNIQPRIEGIRINQIELESNKSGRVIYVVYIPQSKRAPHMAADNRYYRRYEYQSVPMQDYEVKDVMRRQNGPDLRLELNYKFIDTPTHDTADNSYVYVDIDSVIINDSPIEAQYTILRLFVDSRIVCGTPEGGSFTKRSDNEVYELRDIFYNTTKFQTNLTIPNCLPIWQGIRYSIYNNPLRLAFPKTLVEIGQSFLISWQLDSPNMDQKSDFSWISPLGNKVFIMQEETSPTQNIS